MTTPSPTPTTDATEALWGDGGLFDQISRLVRDAEQRGRAEAWDEGLNAGFQIGGEAARREPVTRYDNPYRADEVAP